MKRLARCDFELTPILDRNPDRKRRALPATCIAWSAVIGEVLENNAHVVVEAIGGRDSAPRWIHAAVAAGKSVVTADTQVIASHGAVLLTRVHPCSEVL